jgi:hypothetical protein
MEKNPLKLYKIYLQKKEKALQERDFTQKTFNELQQMKKKLQQMGILPVNKKWNI